jgi:predicted nucleic acid-binding protein
MKSQRIYIYNSILGGYFDEEFEKDTKKLFDKVKKGDCEIVMSDFTESELLSAPEKVKTLLNDLNIKYEVVLLNDEAIALADEYIKEKVVGRTSRNDCLHIAIATQHD